MVLDMLGRTSIELHQPARQPGSPQKLVIRHVLFVKNFINPLSNLEHVTLGEKIVKQLMDIDGFPFMSNNYKALMGSASILFDELCLISPRVA